MADSGPDIANNLEHGIQDALSFKSARDKVSNTIDNVENSASNLYNKAKSTLSRAINGPTTIHEDTAKPVSPPQKAPKLHKGTDYVPKTGTYTLKKGEAVLNEKDADKHRKEKMANSKTYDGAKDELAGSKEEKPKKEIKHIITKKAKGKGGYIHTHVHTHPEVHPDEDHVSSDQDEMADHMLQHLGEPNPGEAEADAGQSGIPQNAAIAQPAGAQPQGM